LKVKAPFKAVSEAQTWFESGSSAGNSFMKTVFCPGAFMKIDNKQTPDSNSLPLVSVAQVIWEVAILQDHTKMHLSATWWENQDPHPLATELKSIALLKRNSFVYLSKDM
jgi:hypothetical protein